MTTLSLCTAQLGRSGLPVEGGPLLGVRVGVLVADRVPPVLSSCRAGGRVDVALDFGEAQLRTAALGEDQHARVEVFAVRQRRI